MSNRDRSAPVERQKPPVADPARERDHSRQGGRPPGEEEHGGPRGPEPTRYGDWEKGGRCTDF